MAGIDESANAKRADVRDSPAKVGTKRSAPSDLADERPKKKSLVFDSDSSLRMAEYCDKLSREEKEKNRNPKKYSPKHI